jgi:hypothetical protein
VEEDRGRKGLGGPQVEDVQHCIVKASLALRSDQDRMESSLKKSTKANTALEEDFEKL